VCGDGRFGREVARVVEQRPTAVDRDGDGRRTEVQRGGDVTDARRAAPAGASILPERTLGARLPLRVLGERAAADPAREHQRTSERPGVVHRREDVRRLVGDGEHVVRAAVAGHRGERGALEPGAQDDAALSVAFGGGERVVAVGGAVERAERDAELTEQLAASRARLREQ
jgi:hypothetical protein